MILVNFLIGNLGLIIGFSIVGFGIDGDSVEIVLGVVVLLSVVDVVIFGVGGVCVDLGVF